MKVYRNLIFPVVLYECETRSLTLREERRLRVFENRVLRKMFGLKRDKVTGEWRKLHTDELNDLYLSPNIIRAIKSRRMRWAEHVECMGERRVMHLRERAYFRGLGINWRIILKWIFKKWDESTMDYIAMSQDRDIWRSFVDATMNYLVP